MSKKYQKKVDRCDQCPAIKYFHFDGEGESAPYSYYHAECNLNGCHRSLPFDCIVKVDYEEYTKVGYVPERKIPNWCSLLEWKDQYEQK